MNNKNENFTEGEFDILDEIITKYKSEELIPKIEDSKSLKEIQGKIERGTLNPNIDQEKVKELVNKFKDGSLFPKIEENQIFKNLKDTVGDLNDNKFETSKDVIELGKGGSKLKIGNVGHNNWVGIAHNDRMNKNDYALLQNKDGTTILNSKGGKNLHIRQGNSDKMLINSSGNVSTNGYLLPKGGIVNQNNQQIMSSDKDWLRIGNNNNPGQTAMYGNVSINDTKKGKSGLSVGAWKSVGQGNIEASGKLTTKNGMNITGGRSYFKDSENKGRVRVGAAWGIPGLYSEDGQDIVVGIAPSKSAHIGTSGKYLSVAGNGNVSAKGNFETTGNIKANKYLDKDGKEINISNSNLSIEDILFTIKNRSGNVILSSYNNKNIFGRKPTIEDIEKFNNIIRSLPIPFYLKFTGTANNGTIYKRLTPVGNWNFFRLLHYDWFNSSKKIEEKNITNNMNTDYKLYNNIEDAIKNTNSWSSCNYNDPGVGFPRDCGKSKLEGGRWISYYPGRNSRRGEGETWGNWSWTLIDTKENLGLGGNVGVGTTKPAAKLHVDGDMYVPNAIHLSKSGALQTYANMKNKCQKIQGTDHYFLDYYAGNTNENAGMGGHRFFQSVAGKKNSWKEALTIDSNSRIGINQSSPQHALDVNGNAQIVGNIKTNNGMNISGGRSYFKDSENKGRVRVGAAWGIPGLYSEDKQDIVVGVDSSKSAHIGHSGKYLSVAGNGNVSAKGNIDTTGNVKGNKLCIGDTCIDETQLKLVLSTHKDETQLKLVLSQGYLVEYYNYGGNNNKGSFISKEIIHDKTIDYDWKSDKVLNSGKSNDIWLTITGSIKIDKTKTDLKFKLSSDDGSRLYFNNQQIISMWQDQGTTSKTSGNISVKEGDIVPFQIDYWENSGGAALKLEWNATGSYKVIPSVYYMH